MIKNYLLTALRNIFRHKGFSLLNIFGLSLSMSVCMLIIVIIVDQFSYDSQHTKKERIYRVQTIDNLSDWSLNKYASTAFPLADELVNNYPFIEEAVLIKSTFNGDGVFNDTRIPVKGLYTNSAFFRVFDFKLKGGSGENFFDEPYKIVLREEIARKYFGEEDPVGKFLQVDSIGSFEVVRIIEETGNKSHIQFEALASASTLESLENSGEIKTLTGNWNNFYTNYVYLLLNEKTNLQDVQNALDKLSVEKYKDDEKFDLSFYLQPLMKIVPGPLIGNELGFFLPSVFVIFLVGLVLVIIISAAFNYTSLSLARSLLRAKEVGVRKTVGALRGQIIVQFLLEAILISLFALFFAYAILQFLLPAFAGMKLMSMLEIKPEQNLTVIIWFLIFALLTGVFSGLLPAVFISAFNPVKVLKGVTNIKLFSRLTLRKILLITQYVFSIIFLISIMLIFRQMNFMVNAEMGFDRDVVYNIRLKGQNITRVHNHYSQIPEVSILSAASHVPGVGNIWDTEIRLDPEGENSKADYFAVDANYIQAMGLELIAGQDFPANISTENEKFIIINEKAVKQFNLGSPNEALGTVMILDDSMSVEIIGVVKDYKYVALFMPLKSLVLRIRPNQFNIAVLRLNSSNMLSTVNKIKNEWKKIDPVHELEGDFLDAEIREYYSFFEDVLYTVGFTCLLAIVIAALGMFGMATYSTQTRLKEIGVRKVFGAHAHSITFLVSRSYFRMLLVAAIIAAPLGYLINNLWLQYLAHHVSFGAGTLVLGIFIVMVIGMLTITSQTMKASNSNPADILKYE
ncbi:MAG: ABC transporter permease [Bacteroidales bacterium]|nr:ABC transporter permease [Bacteroidales bacterium]